MISLKDEIKERIKYFKHYVVDNLSLDAQDDFQKILDYITNLQEKSNNQAEEINRLYKQREKFIKKYGYLKEENEKLKQLCDKYEEEHSTTFNEWKETITDKYQTLKELQQENEKLENDKRGMLVQLYKANDEKDNYKQRIDKAIRYIEKCRNYHRDIHKEERIFPDEITSLLMILNGGDEE